MTEHAPDQGGSSGAADPQAPAHDPELLQLATQAFDLARRGDTDRLAACVDAGVPVDLATDRGDTLLMLAAYHGRPETVRALLRRGAVPDRTNDRGQTPLAGAVFKGDRAVVDALVAAGADPRAGEPSALDTARLFAKADLLELFGAG